MAKVKPIKTPKGDVYPVDTARGDIGQDVSTNVNTEPATDGAG